MSLDPSHLSSNGFMEKNSSSSYKRRQSSSKSRSMRILSTLITLGCIGYGLFWVNENHPDLKNKAVEFLHTGTFHTLEVRFTAKQIMEKQEKVLLKDANHTFSEPVLKFHPYLLMEVKYSENPHGTKEGIILWDLIDGEMVIDAANWEKTHGFADCINANADRYEFKIINLIAQNGGKVHKQALIQSLNIEQMLLSNWIDRCKKKKLIVQEGEVYRIHLEKPKLNVFPSTFIVDPLVTKSTKHTEKLTRHYSPAQIKRAAEAAFGSDFAIRSTRDVFLPVYGITVQNPDGSLHTSHWNALNGQRISLPSLVE